jgi:YD repeat-containing protein
LVELLVASASSVLLFAGVTSMMVYGGKSTAAIGNYMDLDRYSRNALDRMTTDIRQANRVTSCSSNQMALETTNPTTGVTNTLTYTYDSSNRILERTFAGSSVTLLTGITPGSVQFTMFQRNPIGGDVTTNLVTTSPALCKVVQVSWACSRAIVGLGQTENCQSAKVVIRKE